MYPYLFNFIPSYGFFIALGLIAAFVLFTLYFKKNKTSKEEILDLLFVAIIAIIIGICFAVLFDNIYKTIKYGPTYHWGFSMTFMGGLFGGVIGFVGTYFLYYKRHHKPIFDKILIIAPACITLAHGFGRIGCFMAGCCYGLPTDSWIGITFPEVGKVIPTQLIEAIFLFILSAILILFAFKKITNYTMVIYMIAYAIFRFIIEFYRGDDRGQGGGLSPSQIWSIIMFVAAIPMFIFSRKLIFKNKNEN